jgi:thioesterase domain-containing protein
MTSDIDLLDLRTSGAGSPLYCFPGAGGEVGAFEQIASVLPEDWAVCAIECARFFQAHDSFTIEQLAELCLRTVRKNQARGPYHFCGYSLGAVVAYEAAARLALAGEDIRLLALIDAPNPNFRSNLSDREAAQFRKRHFLDRIARYTRNLRSGNFATFLEDMLVFVDSRLGGYPWLVARAAFRTANRPMPAILANKTPKWSAALKAYRPKPYAKRLLLFCSQSHKPEYSTDPTLGWGRHASGGIDVYFVPEEHVAIMSSPQFLAEKLAAYLNLRPRG